ncbi:hypothetical protein BDR26DRAFT_819140 [Obelidium mucronatum]|nr:hypothetical protein BDR26DRAFT_819140 [Obelidium mucronatum]
MAAALAAFRQSIAAGFFANAVFVAERLAALEAETAAQAGRLLLAYALLLNRDFLAAKATLIKVMLDIPFTHQHPSSTDSTPKHSLLSLMSKMSRFLLAKTCLELGHLREAEDCLSKTFDSPSEDYDSSSVMQLDLFGGGMTIENDETACYDWDLLVLGTLSLYCPDDASMHCLMGLIHKQATTYSLAKIYLTKALELNPYLWIAFEALCDMGESPDTVQLKPQKYFTQDASTKYLNSCKQQQQKIQIENPKQPADPTDATTVATTTSLVEEQSSAVPVLGPSTRRTRQPPNTAGPSTRDTKRTKISANPAPLQTQNSQTHQSAQASTTTSTTTKNQEQSSCPVMPQICTLARAYHCFQSFKCAETLALVKTLPEAEANSARVFELVARAYFEMADYRVAEEWFAKTRNLEPHRVSGMDIYSSTLWHLRKEVALSHLAHELVDLHRMKPEAWCAIGNCFSLKREHDVALKCFTRAVQINPNFTYAHTLSGHEYISMEDHDKAMQCFRTAIRCDKRHYNAWFGMGYIYLSQEKYDLAEFHLNHALLINHANPILVVYMGLVNEKKKNTQLALTLYKRASTLRPDIPLYPFRLATLLHALDRNQEALHVLKPLAEQDPCESAVQFLLGKVFAKLGDTTGAMRAFTVAQDVASGKVAAAIRDEIEKIGLVAASAAAAPLVVDDNMMF